MNKKDLHLFRKIKSEKKELLDMVPPQKVLPF